MNGTRRLIVPILLLASILILTVAPFAGATPLSEKRAKAREIAAKLEELYPKVSMAVERYNHAMDSLATVKQQITENERMLKIARYNLDLARVQLETRAVSMYKTRDVGFVDVLFATNSFDELVTQLDVMERLGKSDVDTMKSIASYKRDVNDRQLELEADKEAAVELVATAKAEKEKVESLEAKLERMQAGVKAQIKEIQDQLAAAGRAGRDRPSSGDTSGGGRRSSSTPAGPGIPRSSPSPQRYLGDAVRVRRRQPRPASTAPVSPCTATRRSASACRTAPPSSSRPARRSRWAPCSPATSCSSAAPATATTSASTSAAAR